MTDVRTGLKKSKWRLPKYEHRMLLNFALQYNDWVKELDYIRGLKAIQDGAGVHGSVPGDPTGSSAAKAAELSEKIRLVDEAAEEAGEDLALWIKESVVSRKDGRPYSYSVMRSEYRIPCSRDIFLERRRKFYYILAQKIEVREKNNEKK